ncbi:MAG: BMP family ABC transporter substrate-binding protein [Lachnospiraceae bacterium]|nr:BMP family ABC transporter substrate-binding protein [Lachnospiraceae bacterium]
MMKKFTAILLTMAMLCALLAGCAGKDTTATTAAGGDSGKETTQASASGGDETQGQGGTSGDLSSLKVCAIFTGPRGDSGTIDMACAALEAIAAETGMQITLIEGDGSADVAKVQASVTDVSEDGYDLILSTGTMADVFRIVAPDYPDTMYALFDTTFDFTTYEGNNIYCANFKQNEGAYLAGMLAMGVSKSGTIGFVGGMENANICDFMWGYVEGAKHVKESGIVAISFTGDWYDSAKAKEIALTQVNMGADVLFPAAGPSSEGVMEGAAEAKVNSIGVDIDREAQYGASNPDWVEVILSSELKCVDKAVDRAVRLFAAGELKPGQEALGIAEGGVDLYMDGNYQTLVPDEIKTQIEAAKAAIISGEITVGTALGASAEEIAQIKSWAGATE